MSVDLLDQLRIQIRTRIPYFMLLSNLVRLELGDKMQVKTTTYPVKTCITDGDRIVINEDFLRSLSPSQRLFVVCRMILSVVRKQHLMRFGRDQKAWDEACEQVALNQLQDYLDEFKGDDSKKAPISPPKDLKIDRSFQGMTEFQVFDKMPKGKGGGQGQGGGNGKGGGQGQGEGQPGNLGNTQTGSVVSGNFTPQEIQVQSKKIADALMQADVMSKKAGKGSGVWGSLAIESMDVGPDPESLLMRFVTNSLPTMRTWKRPDPRYLAMGQYYPAELKNNIGELVILLDCSGSMSRDDVADGVAWVHNACQKCHPEKVHIVYFTGIIERVDIFKWNEPFIVPDELPSGGTSFAAAQKYLDEVTPKCVIWFTDGWDTYPEDPGIPTLWLMTEQTHVPPFGDMINFYSRIKQC